MSTVIQGLQDLAVMDRCLRDPGFVATYKAIAAEMGVTRRMAIIKMDFLRELGASLVYVRGEGWFYEDESWSLSDAILGILEAE